MNLPDVFFPTHVRPHDKTREIFADYGKYLHVDITNVEDLTFRTQTAHPGSKTNLRLSATTPTLPLAQETHIYAYPFEDRVSSKVIDKKLRTKDFITRFPRLKYRISKEKAKQEQQINTSWFSTALNTYKEFKKDPFVPSVNAAYTGGCIACVGYSGNDDIHLVQAAGPDFDILRLVSVITNPSTDLLEQTAVSDQRVDSQIFEVVSSKTGQNEFSAVRLEYGYELFKLKRSDSVKIVSLDKRSFHDERLTSLALSPYINGEVLVATEKGSLYLISPGESVKTIKENWLPRFKCFEPWRQCYFAAHPRQFVTADRTVVKLLDSRTKFEENVDLFALPNKLVQPSERVMVAKQQTSCAFHHIVATDASMFVIDQRFPGHPLSHWSFSQKSPPQYISSCDLSVSDDIHTNIITVGTQHPPEVYCFHVQFGGLSPLQTVAQPWRLSRISDFSRFEEVTVCADMTLLQKRFATSLAGLTTCPGPTPSSLHTFQLDSHGEVFFQTYKSSSSAVDKTLSAGPGGQQGYLDGAAAGRAGGWLDGLQNTFIDYCTANPHLYRVITFNCEYMSTDFLAKHQTHTLCPLCTCESDSRQKTHSQNKTASDVCDMCGYSQKRSDIRCHGQCSPERGAEDGERVCENCGEQLVPSNDSPDQQSPEGEFMEGIDRCESCGHSLKVAELLYGIRSKNCIADGDSVDLELFNRQVPSLDQVPHSSPNSQILTKLWRGDSDIMDLVASREEERKKKKEEKKKIEAEKKGDDKTRKKKEVTDSIESSDDGEIIKSEEGSESDHFEEEDVKHEEFEIEDETLKLTSVKTEFVENKLVSAISSEMAAVSNQPAAESESGVTILGFYAIPTKSEMFTTPALSPAKATTSASPYYTRLKDNQWLDDVESLVALKVTDHTDRSMYSESTKRDALESPDEVEQAARQTQQDLFKSPDVTKTKHTSDSYTNMQKPDIFKSPSQTKTKHTSGQVVKRRRHSSTSSERSTHSHASSIGFLATPPRLKRKDSWLGSVVPDEDDNESLELFSQFDAHSFIASTLQKVKPPSYTSPTNQFKGSQKKKPVSKSKKKYISGF